MFPRLQHRDSICSQAWCCSLKGATRASPKPVLGTRASSFWSILSPFGMRICWAGLHQELAPGTNPDLFNSTSVPSHTSSSPLALPVWIWGWGFISAASLTHPHIVLGEQDVRKLTVEWRIFFFFGGFVFCFKKMKRLFPRKWDVFYKHPLLKPIVSHPRNPEIRCKHIRSSQSSTWRENLNPKHLHFNFLCLCPKTAVGYET